MTTKTVRLFLLFLCCGLAASANAAAHKEEVYVPEDNTTASRPRSATITPKVWFDAELKEISVQMLPTNKMSGNYILTVRSESGAIVGSTIVTADGSYTTCPLASMEAGIYTIELVGKNTYKSTFLYTR